MDLNESLKISTGAGVKIGLIDTGVREDITIQKTYNFSSSKNIYDSYGSGSTQALLIQDVAPISEIYSYKVGEEGLASDEAIEQAIMQSISDEVDILCISLENVVVTDNISLLIKQLTDAGAIVLSAASNGSSSLYIDQLDQVVSVGAYDKTCNKLNQRNDIDVWLPGVDIPTYYEKSYLQEPYDYKTGTSYASALATGYLATLLEHDTGITNKNFIYIMQKINIKKNLILIFIT